MDVSLYKGAQNSRSFWKGKGSVTVSMIEAKEEVTSEKLIMDLAWEYSIPLQSIWEPIISALYFLSLVG